MAITWISSEYSTEYLKACVASAVVGEVYPKMRGVAWKRRKTYVAKSSFYTPEEDFKRHYGKSCETIEEAKQYIEDTFAAIVAIYNKPRNYGSA